MKSADHCLIFLSGDGACLLKLINNKMSRFSLAALRRHSKTASNTPAASPKLYASAKKNRSRSIDSNLPRRINKLEHQTSLASLEPPRDNKQTKASRSIPNLATNSKDPTLSYASSLGLSSHSQRALVLSWNNISAENHKRGALVFVRRVLFDLCAAESGVNSTFVQYAFVKVISESGRTVRSKEEHVKLVTDVLGQTVARLNDDAGEVRKKLFEIGKKHAELQKFGFKPKYWEMFGEKFVDLISTFGVARKFPDSARAWTVLIAAITDALTAGCHSRNY